MNIGIEQYNEFINLLYEAATDATSESWTQPLKILQEAFAANYVTLILKLPEEDDLGLMVAVGKNISREHSVQNLPYQYKLTPFTDQAPDKVFTVDDFMSEVEWQESSYRQHWCAVNDVFHVMSVDISTENHGNLRLRVTREESLDNFSSADKALCEMLIPHFRRSITTFLHLYSSASLGSLYSNAIGRLSIATITINDTGQVLDKNMFASQILDAADGLKISGGKLVAQHHSDNRELKRLIKTAFEHAEEKKAMPEAMSVSRPSGEIALGLVIEVIPTLEWADGKNQKRAVIYIRDAVGKSMTSIDISKKLFGLTPAETALTLQLINGLSLEESAEALNIRRNTARAHLRSIFSKTGVRRQTELVRLFLNSVAALGYDEAADLQ
ncbi:helix-turn-helix transcriptional regulator [Aliiglaciecola lipolytica]|uniref:Transcriptional regulator, LuxR family n=1 Tax=Aliiglaciecola lipolytica E3 TaxID=1127673 RepID=K6YT94_9ALTE|nr:helix-turn-helix transcriptional regulator [Aliiglaciecola lipolytica]GAC14515.1 transcriptional regulator, LuxR family [Aliiglaciecola lipolytica E3]